MKLSELIPFARKEREVLGYVEKHLDLVTRTVDSFEKFLKLAMQTEWEEAFAEYETMNRLETEADALHREGTIRVAHGAFFGGLREDILSLMEKVDSIADSAKDSAKVLLAKKPDDRAVNTLLASEHMEQYVDSCLKAVYALGEAVRSLNVNKKVVLSKIHAVEDFEEEADAHRDALMREMAAVTSSIDAFSLMQFRDFVVLVDNIADNAEDATDVMLILIAKGYG